MVVCLFTVTVSAQYVVPWFKIAGGGAMQSAGGVYTLSGTIGQPDAGRAAGGSYRSEGGFWGIAVQQAGFPPLNITQSGANALVSWSTIETGFILQSATDLGSPTAWADSGLTPVVNTGTFAFKQVANAGNIFSYKTRIDNPVCDNDPNAILIFSRDGGGGAFTFANKVRSVTYSGTNWWIYNDDGTAMVTGETFYVLVIKN